MVAGKGSELGHRLTATDIPHHMVSIGNLSFLNPLKIIKLVRLFKKERPDVLIMNLPADLKSAGIAARLAGVKRIIYRRGSAIAVKDSFLNRLLFRYVLDDIIANSARNSPNSLLLNNQNLFPRKRYMLSIMAWIGGSLTLCPQTPVYRPEQAKVVLGNAGRLVPQKGQDILIQVAKQLKNKRVQF